MARLSRRELAAVVLALTGCARDPRAKRVMKYYPMTGVLKRIEGPVLTVAHDKIVDPATGKTWMEAMTMEFPVKGGMPEGLKAGDRVKGRVCQPEGEFEYWLDQVEAGGVAK